MAEKILFFVQPYEMRRQKLVAGGAQIFLNDSDALKSGAVLARRRAGVVVLSQTYDPVRRQMNRPTVLRIHGHVPAEWGADRQAA